jgi:type II secretory pathway component PulM
MAASATYIDELNKRMQDVAKPLLARWNSLTPQQRMLSAWAAAFIVASLILAFVIMPAVNTRRSLMERLPQLESRLAVMRSQAVEVAALYKQTVEASAPRTAASVASLQTIFGPDARVSAVPEGFRVIVPAMSYAGWWDKISEATTSYGLTLKDTSLVRAGGTTPATVAVDMRLAFEAKPATSPGGTGTTSAGK